MLRLLGLVARLMVAVILNCMLPGRGLLCGGGALLVREKLHQVAERPHGGLAGLHLVGNRHEGFWTRLRWLRPGLRAATAAWNRVAMTKTGPLDAAAGKTAVAAARCGATAAARPRLPGPAGFGKVACRPGRDRAAAPHLSPSPAGAAPSAECSPWRARCGRSLPGCTIVSDTRRRSLSTASTQTLTMSPTATTSCGSRTKRSARWLTCTRPLSCMPMSTKQPKSTTFSTVPVNSMPASRSSSLITPCLKIGAGKSSRGIASRTGQLGQNVPQRQLADLQFLGHRLEVDRPPARPKPAAVPSRVNAAGVPPSRSSTRWPSRSFPDESRCRPGAVAAADFQEPGRLHEACFAQTGHLAQLLAVAEGTVLAAKFIEPPRGQLVQARDISQQRRAGRVDVHAHVVHARFDHLVQRRPQVFGLHVVLIEAHADAGRIDLDQLAERILQAAADRDGAAERGIVVGKLFAAQFGWSNRRWPPPR